MNQVTTPAIVYKIMHYSDRSAVALAFSKECGKLKLFMPKAYSSKGGFMTFVPGSITFNRKETSDLHRFVSFNHDPAFYHYTQTPEIMMRMHLLYDFYDNLFHQGELCQLLWQLSLKFDETNYRKLCLYAIYRLLRHAGIMFNFTCECGASDTLFLHQGQMYCTCCLTVSKSKTIQLDTELISKLHTFENNDVFRKIEFSESEEKAFLKLFSSHIDQIMGKNGLLKSLSVFLSMQ